MEAIRKALRVKVLSVKHLPKMDRMGKCDPIISVSFGGKTDETKVVKKVYDATFDEVFDYELNEETKEAPGDLLVAVLDWKRIGANQKVGENRLSEERMLGVCGEAPGWVLEQEFEVMSGGKAVKGYDGQMCLVKIQVEIIDRGVVKMSEAAAKASFKSSPKKNFSSSQGSLKDLTAAGTMAEVEVDEEASGPRNLTVTVVHGRHLPKMDSGFMGMGGKVDAFCVLDLGGITHETSVKKGNFSPDWGETFSFALEVGQVPSPLLVKVLDWNQVGSPDEVGELAVSRQRILQLLKAKDGWEGTDTFLIQKEGERVTGHDKLPAQISLKFKVSVPDVLFSAMEAGEGVKGARVVEFTVLKARNVPKMDLMGACDCFVEIVFEGRLAGKTDVVKNTLSPDFDESFEVLVDDAETMTCTKDVIVRLLDWNMTGDPDVVGESIVSAARMSEIIRSKDGSSDTEAIVMMMKGKPVVGKNKSECEVSVKISVSNVKNAFDGIVPVQGETVSGPRRIDFTLEGVEHLPKMDGMFGKCDAYAVLSFDGAEYRTEVVKNAYDARWDAAFHLDVDEAEKGTNSGATVTVFDWDAASKDDEIGSFAISAARMSELFRGNLDSEARQVFSVRLDGKSVIGHDKRKCELSAKVKISNVPLAFESITAVEGVKGPRRLEVNIFSVSNLPNMDGMLGKCDPYALLTWEQGMEFGRTSTKKNTYEAEWDETLTLDLEDAHAGTKSDVLVTVMDWDRANEDDVVGSFKLSAARVSELFRGGLGSSSDDTFTLMMDGRPVIGHSKSKCVIRIKIRVSDVPIAFPSIMPENEVGEARRLEFTMVSVSSLPKMDGMFGKCDPYALLTFLEKQYKTDVVKNTYDAEWMDTFCLDMGKAQVMSLSSSHLEEESQATSSKLAQIVIGVMDWDKASQDDEVGTFSIPSGRVLELFCAKIGSHAEGTFPVMSGGRPVLGHDKKRCSVTVRVRVCDVPIPFPKIESVASTSGPRRLELCVSCVNNLPNMDGMLGKCDAYAILCFEGVEFRTETKKNAYDATWEAWFNLDLEDVAKGLASDCTVTVMDWDATSKDDEVGSFAISAERMGELFRANLGSSALHKFLVMQDGRPVRGHNKNECEVELKIKVSEVPLPFPTLVGAAVESIKGARRLELTVLSINSLPKMDGMFGKCDPYAIVSFEGVEYRTQTKKNTYDAEYGECFCLDVDDAALGTRSDLLVTVFDWDAASKDDEIGVVRVSAARLCEMYRAGMGDVAEDSLAVKAEGAPVTGHDRKTCTVSLRAKICEAPLAFPSIKGVEGTRGERRLEVTIISASSLPKMDGMFGKCDPYAVLLFDGVENRTETKKNTYEAEWNETFFLDVMAAEQGASADAVVTLWDWDAVGKNDEIGRIRIPAARLADLFRAELGSAAEESFPVMQGGKPVVGHDKNQTQLKVAVKVAEVPRAFSTLEAEEGSTGPRRLEVTLVGVQHLPKMDGIMGRCDAYSKMLWRGIEYKTQVVKNSYDAEWNSVFSLDVEECANGAMSDCQITLFDWDMASKDDEIGSFRISASRMDELFRAKLDSSGEHSFFVMSEGKPVVGHDKEKTVLSVKVRVCVAPVAFPRIEASSEGAEGERRVELTVASVSHLPRMDGMFGKCDPYIVVSFDGQDYTTEVVKNCYDAEFGETFNLDVASAKKGTKSAVKVTVFDWDAASKDDEVGTFRISAERMSNIFRGDLDADDEETFLVLDKGQPVVGHDKQPCTVTLKARVRPVPRLFSSLMHDPEAKGPRRIELEVIGARNLPKMDVMGGTCDAYVKVQYGTRPEFTTSTVKASYSPEWKEKTTLEHEDVLEMTLRAGHSSEEGDLLFTVWDWDVATAHDKVGDFTISRQDMAKLWLADDGSESVETALLVSKGRNVIGHNKLYSELLFRVKVTDEVRPVGLCVQLKSTSGIPRMDPLDEGAIPRPYALIGWQGVDWPTKVIEDAAVGGSVDWGEVFSMDGRPEVLEQPLGGVHQDGSLSLSIYDDDGTCFHDLIAQAKLTAKQVRNVLRGKFGYLQDFVLETGGVGDPGESGDVDGGDGSDGGDKKRGKTAIKVSFSIKVFDWATEGALQDKRIHPQKASIASWAFSCLGPVDEGGVMLAGKAKVDEMLSGEGWVGMSEDELEELWQGDWAGLQIQGLSQEKFADTALSRGWKLDPHSSLTRPTSNILHLAIESARNLPGIASSSHPKSALEAPHFFSPYVSAKYSGVTRKTGPPPEESAEPLSPVWNRVLSFLVDSHGRDGTTSTPGWQQEAVSIAVIDGNRQDKACAVGGVRITADELESLVSSLGDEADAREMPLMGVCEGDGEWAEPILGADGNAATIRFKIYATRPVAAPEEVEVVVEEEEEELQEVDINALRDLCLCHRACDQLACRSRSEILDPGQGDARPRWKDTFLLCPILMNYHTSGRIKIIGL